MAEDLGDEVQFDTVLVPVSLIQRLSFELLHAIDEWHEEREIENLDLCRCMVAMMAAVDATMERLHNYPNGETIQ
jgi:hypothetical protein